MKTDSGQKDEILTIQSLFDFAIKEGIEQLEIYDT